MENPQLVLGTLSILCLLLGGIPLLSAQAASWHVRSTVGGRAAAAA